MTRRTVLFLDPRGHALAVARLAAASHFAAVALISDPAILSQEDAAIFDRVIAIEDPTQIEAVRGQIADIAVAGVYFSSEPCAALGVALRRAAGLPAVSGEAMSLITDKYLLRRRLVEAGLSKLRNFTFEEMLDWPFTGPAFFKPRHGLFSAHVARVTSREECEIAERNFRARHGADPAWVAKYVARAGGHVEEAHEGELLSVEAISRNGKLEVFGLLSRILYSRNSVVEMGSCFPYPHPLAEKIIAHVTAAHLALGMTDGPSHTEVIVDAGGNIEIVDFNPRFVGADVIQSVNHACGVDVAETLLAWALGREGVRLPSARRFSCLQYFLPPGPMQIESIELPRAPEVLFAKRFVADGARVESVERQLDYLGCYLTVMDTFEGALRRSRELRDAVKVNGMGGVF